VGIQLLFEIVGVLAAGPPFGHCLPKLPKELVHVGAVVAHGRSSVAAREATSGASPVAASNPKKPLITGNRLIPPVVRLGIPLSRRPQGVGKLRLMEQEIQCPFELGVSLTSEATLAATELAGKDGRLATGQDRPSM
jgi:hypothetical protein